MIGDKTRYIPFVSLNTFLPPINGINVVTHLFLYEFQLFCSQKK